MHRGVQVWGTFVTVATPEAISACQALRGHLSWSENRMFVGAGHVPEVGCSVPHHLVLLQRQALNNALAVLHKLAAQGVLNRLHHA